MNYIDGEYTEESQIPAYDLGFLRGAGIFQYFRTYQKHPFQLDERLKRLFTAAKETGIDITQNLSDIKAIIDRLIAEALDDITIRIIATKGISEDGLIPHQISALYILTKPVPTILHDEGIRAITTPATRILPHIKTLNYFSAILALEKARKQGASEALYINEKQEILEATTANFFAIKGNTIVTSDSKEVLPGVTRKILLELASPIFKIEYRNLPLKELPEIEEAFLTSSIKEIVPLTAVDKENIGQGLPGQKTMQLQEKFKEKVYAHQSIRP